MSDETKIDIAQDDRPIWERIAELAEHLPEDVVAQMPSDAASQLDHYLYGAPKMSETSVNRYGCFAWVHSDGKSRAAPQERQDGDYVRYTDYDSLKAERDRLSGLIDRLCGVVECYTCESDWQRVQHIVADARAALHPAPAEGGAGQQNTYCLKGRCDEETAKRDLCVVERRG